MWQRETEKTKSNNLSWARLFHKKKETPKILETPQGKVLIVQISIRITNYNRSSLNAWEIIIDDKYHWLYQTSNISNLALRYRLRKSFRDQEDHETKGQKCISSFAKLFYVFRYLFMFIYFNYLFIHLFIFEKYAVRQTKETAKLT